MNEFTHSARRLNYLSDKIGAKLYLEIGVEKGKTFFDVNVRDKVAVDPAFRFDPNEYKSSNLHFFPGYSDLFFENYFGPKFDLIFLDGLHEFEQTLRDLQNALIHSSDNSLILIDDVFPTDVYSSLREHADANHFRKMSGSEGEAWHGDVFKLVFFIHDFMPNLDYVTIDDGWNRQTLLWKRPRRKFIPLFNNLETISRLNYFDIVKYVDVFKFLSEDKALEIPFAEQTTHEHLDEQSVLSNKLLSLPKIMGSVAKKLIGLS